VLHTVIGMPALVFASPSPANAAEHSAAIVLEVADKLDGCAVGELDPTRAGQEIVVTCGKGAVLVAHRAAEGWEHENVFQAPGEMIQVVVGDARRERAGDVHVDEIVVVGMRAGPEGSGGPGAAYLIARADAGWKAELLLESPALLHGAAIGPEGIYVTGFDRKVHLLVARGDAFERVASAELPGNGKNALAFPGGVVVACTDGSLVEARLVGGALSTTTLDRRESGRARLGGTREQILVSDDDGTLALVTSAGRRELYRDTAKLRGAVLADLDPTSPGLEAATAGYSGRVTILREHDGGSDRGSERGFVPSLLFADRAGFHHAAAGELDGAPGLELVVCGMAGRVLVFHFGG
jgi:hypothetical protein